LPLPWKKKNIKKECANPLEDKDILLHEKLSSTKWHSNQLNAAKAMPLKALNIAK
jgi:hypothetical protein